MPMKALIMCILPGFGLVLWLCSKPLLSRAQETVVQGVVTDEEGKPIKDALLTLVDPERGFKFVLKTDKKGKFIKEG